MRHGRSSAARTGRRRVSTPAGTKDRVSNAGRGTPATGERKTQQRRGEKRNSPGGKKGEPEAGNDRENGGKRVRAGAYLSYRNFHPEAWGKKG